MHRHSSRRVRDGEFKILVGTDAASEGLNPQRLATLINLDLPWNPTRLDRRRPRRRTKARETIDAVPDKHPFEAKYNQIARINWESCAEVLNRVAAKEALERGW